MVFTDASSAILLYRAGLFSRLTRAFSIVFASSVFDELTRPGYVGVMAFKQAVDKKQVAVRTQADPEVLTAWPGLQALDPGEKETLCLFLETRQGFILTDDGKAARLCHRLELPFINALLVPRIFYFAGILDEQESKTHMKNLGRSGRYSEKILTIADGLDRTDLNPFIQGIKQ